jgi:hypothetical protein
MTENQSVCSRCGARNSAQQRVCYACGRPLTADYGIPDPLLDPIRAAPPNSTPPLYPKEQRLLIASIATAFPLILLVLLALTGWGLFILFMSVISGIGLLVLIPLILGLVALWSWALKGT